MFNSIITAALVVGILGLLLGALLAYASKIFAVETDPRADAILEVLPGANCGGCGFAGCAAVAEAIASGKAPVNTCPVGGADVAAKVAVIMGQEAVEMEKQVAFVHCHACQADCAQKFEYYGEKDCVQAAAYQNGSKVCESGCLGFGSCVSVCKFGAIRINDDGVAEVDPEKCTSCGACVEICPKGLISFMPYGKGVNIGCSNKGKGKTVKAACASGCIACGICEKNCPFDAVHVNKETNLPEFDYEKCRGCLICAEKCPQHCIVPFHEKMQAVVDEEKCIGCGQCQKVCPKEAIEGEKKVPHKVDPEKCIGCGLCTEKCKMDAIHLVPVKK
ncbi:MAG: RnfABCDGE type electron transport complex subunit B [Eubacteriaceae bacterium]|nr:RnfABCDGE type electron transport complex subunit B [Eubacteriaceae bacterium]